MSKNIRQPAVAGQFYPADACRLELKIKEFLENTKTSPPALSLKQGEGVSIKAIIVPHAGYDFSGLVAAYAYGQLAGKNYENVILIGNSHSAYFKGAGIDDSDAWNTPLGEVTINKDLAKKLAASDRSIKISSEGQTDEHSLEVQLPFLQTVLTPGFKIVPILFGNTHDDTYKKLAMALKNNIGANDLIVISTDMSHYPSYNVANKIDQETLAKIKAKDIDKLNDYISNTEGQGIPNEDTLACGVDGIRTIMELANLSGWEAEILYYANSGDTAIGEKNRVVGYRAIAFASAQVESLKFKVKSDNELNQEQKKILLDIVKLTIESYVKEKKIVEFNITDERLKWKEGAFVTLKKDGELRGCIGQIIPGEDSLWQVVRDMAIAASTEDYRFGPVRADELPRLQYGISVLSKPEVIENWQDIKMGVHGVIIQKGRHTGVFLPQVATETGWSLDEFMSELCVQKAGLPEDAYKNDSDVVIKIFTAQVF